MELKSLYNIKSFDTKENKIAATVVFNARHPVFEGHFPENPVVPGVVQVQIIKDLIEKVTKRKIFMNKAKSIKFLNVITPAATGQVIFEISYEHINNSIKIKAIVKSDTGVFMKYSGEAKNVQVKLL